MEFDSGPASEKSVQEEGRSHSEFSQHVSEEKKSSEKKPMDFIHAIRKKLATKEALFVFIIFILGFAVRAQLMRYELFFEFDSYWHARMVSYILQGLPVPTVDPLAYYQNVSAATFGNPPLVFWYLSAFIYKLFTLNAPYDFELWVLFVKILPALYGALISVVMYFLGKELFKGKHEQAAGLFAGIFAATVPSFVYRTMAGFFEDDSLGFLWMVLGFVFFVRAVREPEWTKEKIRDAILAGVSFALMAFTWPAFNMLVPVLLGMGFVQFLLWVNENELEKAKHYAGLWFVSFGLLAVGATIQRRLLWLDQFGGILGGFLFGVQLNAINTIVVIALIWAVAAMLWYGKKKIDAGPTIIKVGYTVVVLSLVLLPLVIALFDVNLRTGDVLGQTIGEESQGKNYFGNKYSYLILFAIIGIPAMGYLLLKKSKDYSFLAVPLVWLIVTFFMAWGKLKFTYYWGLPLGLTGAVVLTLGLNWMNNRSSRNVKKAVAFGIAFMIFSGVAVGTLFVTQNIPNIEISSGWKTALFWADENLPKDAKFFNWWDEGHWISFLSNRKTLIDNRNADTSATRDVALFIIETDTNKAYDLVKKYDSTHLIFGDDLLEKMSNLGFYAYNITNASDSRIQGIFGAIVGCSKQQTALTKEISISCGGNTFQQDEFNNLPILWQSGPNTFIAQNTPGFVYREKEGNKLYVFSTRANQLMLVRLWMGDPAVKEKFTEIYRNTGGVRIYEVN